MCSVDTDLQLDEIKKGLMSVSFFFYLFKESFLANTISFRYMLLHSKHEECCGFYNFKTTPSKTPLKLIMWASEIIH